MTLEIKTKTGCKWDLVSLGEVMLRFDPEEDRIHTARSFRVFEGGGEYNVARDLCRCFGLKTAIVTALAGNQIGELVEDLIRQGGVDPSNILWRETDGISRAARNGIYFIERGFGRRSPVGCSDRGNTAVSQLKPGDVDWQKMFVESGTRWFHTGGIFAGLSDTTPQVAHEAMQAARAAGAVVSYDLNYRASLWSDRGGRDAADKVNRDLLAFADVVFGVEGFKASLADFRVPLFTDAAEKMQAAFPNLQVIATTLRDISSASQHELGGACFSDGTVYRSHEHTGVEVLDRVGSGDAFAAGLIYGILNGTDLQHSIEIAASSAVLALTTLGDGSAATLQEIEALASKQDPTVSR